MNKQATVSQATREAAYQVTRNLPNSASQNTGALQIERSPAALNVTENVAKWDFSTPQTMMFRYCMSAMLFVLFLRLARADTGLPKLLLVPFAFASAWAIVTFVSKLFFPKKKS